MTEKTTGSEIAISVKDVAKYFNPSRGQRSIKNAFTSMFHKEKDTIKKDGYWALKNINFEVKKGEFFGIVGRNGSGKSTLLKIIAGVYTPSKGDIHVNGKLVPFIELGVGFNPELTGTDNVYLNGALLGFSRKEMAAMYDEIVNFAELREHMDVKLKNFSSGMQVRLAFSIAIRAKSDVLLIDEVLAVGDEAFQQKCIDVFEDYKANGKTVVLVTHDMGTVRKYCTRALLIHDGEALTIGDPDSVATKYSKLNLVDIANDVEKENSKIKKKSLISVKLLDGDGKSRTQFKVGDVMTVEVGWPSDAPVAYVGVSVIKKSGEYIFGANTLADKYTLKDNKVIYSVSLDLGPGKYRIGASLSGKNERDVIDYLEDGPSFIISATQTDKAGGLVRLQHNWKES